MDVNETLRLMREALSEFEDTRGGYDSAAINASSDMRDRFVALDEWLSRGGYLPADWNHGTEV